MNKKTNITMLWIAILVLMISLMLESFRDHQLHQQFRLHQQEEQEKYIEHMEEEMKQLHKENQLIEQILNIVERK